MMNKQTKRGIVLIIAGVVMICIALGIFLLQQAEDQMAGQTADSLLRQLELNKPVIGAGEDTQNTQQDTQISITDKKMPPKEFLGYSLCGSLQIDSVGIHLPILADWNYDMLKIAPCRYQGSISDENLVIMGHNYKSHFTPLHSVAVGDAVTFENTLGKVFHYRVAEIVYLKRTEGEKLPSEYPLTVFTCTPGGLERIVVRCEYAE